MKDGGVIAAAKSVTDFRQAVVRELFCESHRHLPWSSHRAASVLRVDVRDSYAIVIGDSLLYVVEADEPLLQGKQIVKSQFGRFDIDGLGGEPGVGNHAVECPLQFADV